jgi:uncharacterized membrane protein
MSYVLSFIYIGIYWNNHHHMLHMAKQVTGKVLWANLHLLFWLSILPFATGWMGENEFAAIPSAIYGAVLLMAGSAYWLLEQAIVQVDGKNSSLATAVGKGSKENASIVSYGLAIVSTFFYPWIAQFIYVAVAVLWLIPDRRIECAILDRAND